MSIEIIFGAAFRLKGLKVAAIQSQPLIGEWLMIEKGAVGKSTSNEVKKWSKQDK